MIERTPAVRDLEAILGRALSEGRTDRARELIWSAMARLAKIENEAHDAWMALAEAKDMLLDNEEQRQRTEGKHQ